MKELPRTLLQGMSFLAVPLAVLSVGPAASWAGDWRARFYIGPPRDPEAMASYEAWRRSPVPPDSQLPEVDFYYWPSFREALSQYGWFGRKACSSESGAWSSSLPVSSPAVRELPATGELMPPPQPTSTPVRLGRPLVLVVVPDDAEVSLDGSPTKQTGRVRVFLADRPRGAEASHEVRVRWVDSGQEITNRQTIIVRPGDRVVVNYLTSRRSDGE
jgi:uncharacterized protein (TIGR03000 family)